MIWLASASPRRRQLLEWAGHAVDVHPADVDESRDPADAPVAHAARLAALKARDTPADRIVLAADTVVHRDDRIFDKPRGRLEARQHLLALSGGWHEVTTGVCVRLGDAVDTFTVTTRVRFRALQDYEIDAYLATGDADDKAGAYGIQGRAAVFVAEVRGSWTNVVGLPTEEVLPRLRALSVAR
ncbi:MAG: septum formation protein [Myxococcota bacterium]|jgi:septum formation protein